MVDSPTASPRSQPPLGKSDVDGTTTVDSSPLPARTRHAHSHSTARKRTNEELYEPAQQPKTSPTTSRFQKSTVAMTSSTGETPARTNSLDTNELLRHSQPQQPALTTPTRAVFENDITRPEMAVPSTMNDKFVKEVQEYQGQLEQEFREFEQALAQRDTTAALDPLDWDDLEARYNKEMQPNIAAEQDIMAEFNARFEVCLVGVCSLSLLTDVAAIYALHAGL